MGYEEIAARLLEEVESIEHEVQAVYGAIVRPRWDSDKRRFPSTLYGLIMTCFATVDLASRYWAGYDSPQTPRMLAFLDRYVGPRKEAHDVAVQMWRHTLMHIGTPRIITDTRTHMRYNWVLYWSDEHISDTDHMTFKPYDSRQRTLWLSLMGLVKDLRRGLDGYVVELREDAELQKRLLDQHVEIEDQRFRTRD